MATIRMPAALPSSQSPVAAQSAPSDVDALRAELAAAQAKLAALAAKGASRITVKRSEKGAVSVYGLGRWPVTLYASQWERLLNPGMTKDILAFIETNRSTLAFKE